MAAALPDNSIDCRKTKARAFSEFLGRKEGFENAALSLRVHPDSSIGNCQQDVCARLLGLVPACVVLIQVNIGRFNHQLPALRHRIPGVDRQIHDHLLDLALIGFDAPQRGPSVAVKSISSPIKRWSIFSTCRTIALRSKTLGSSTCWRLNARSWRVNEAALCPAFLICPHSLCRGSFWGRRCSRISL